MSLCTSGDMDAVCSFISTQYVLDILGLPIEAYWRPWHIDNEVHIPVFIWWKIEYQHSYYRTLLNQVLYMFLKKKSKNKRMIHHIAWLVFVIVTSHQSNLIARLLNTWNIKWMFEHKLDIVGTQLPQKSVQLCMPKHHKCVIPLAIAVDK